MKIQTVQPYPQGRWTSKPAGPALAELKLAPLRTLFWNADESALVLEAAEKVDLLVKTAAASPPFLTGMDCPLPETV